MNFFTTLSEKLGFKPKENDEEREEDELEDDEEQDDEDEEEDEERPSRFSLNNPFGKNKKQASSSRRRAVVSEDDEEDEEEEFDVKPAIIMSFTIREWTRAPRRNCSIRTAKELSTFARLKNVGKSSNICCAEKAFCSIWRISIPRIADEWWICSAAQLLRFRGVCLKSRICPTCLRRRMSK